jgi:hypothetical protein
MVINKQQDEEELWKIRIDGISTFFLFVIVGLPFHLAFYYFFLGVWLFTCVVLSVVNTVMAACIFLPLYWSLGRWKAIAVGSALYAAAFVTMYSYAFVPGHFTMRENGKYLFEDGHVTWSGISSLLPVALTACGISIITFLIVFRHQRANSYRHRSGPAL